MTQEVKEEIMVVWKRLKKGKKEGMLWRDKDGIIKGEVE